MEQILVIIGDNIPDVEKIEYYSNISLVNHASWKSCKQFTDQVANYLLSVDETLKVTKTSDIKAIMHRRLSNYPSKSTLVGIYKIDLLHGIVELSEIYHNLNIQPA